MTTTLALQTRLARNPGVVLEKLAAEHAVSVAEVIECLPAAMWHKLDGTHAETLLQALPALGELTVIVHSADAIFEFTGPFPPGETGHGFYNLHGNTGLHGHLRLARCQAVYWVERPFMGRASASLLFTNLDGGIMFKVFVGRDATGELKAEQRAALQALCGVAPCAHC